MKRTVLTLAAVLAFSTFALADIARPQPDKTPKPKAEKLVDAPMEIRLDSEAKEAKLLIPRSQLKSLRAALDDLDNGDENTAAVTASGFSRTQTIMAGLFMSLAIVFGGIWVARSGKMASKGVKAAVLTLGIGAIATAATFVYANAGPPAEARSITGKMFSQAVHIYGFGWGQVKIGISDTDRVRLIVPDPKDDKPSGEE
jgi:preprotein translocase subunit SecG